MRVRMTTKIGGYRNGEEWPDKGGTIDLPEHEARSLIAAKYATEIEEEQSADEDATGSADDGPDTDSNDGAGHDTADDESSGPADTDPMKPVKPTAKRPAKKASTTRRG